MDVKLKQWPSDFPKTFSKNTEIRKEEKYINSDWGEVNGQQIFQRYFPRIKKYKK